MIKINLLPVKAAKKKERIMQQIVIGLAIIIAAAGGLTVLYLNQKNKIAEVNAEIDNTKKEIAKLREAKKKYEELVKKSAILDKQLDAIEKLDTGRDFFIKVLDRITESVPRNQVWITSIKWGGKSKGKKSSGSSGDITIRGSSYDKDSVALFMGNLSVVPCDDALADVDKDDICRTRNERCRTWNEDTNNWEWNYENCRKFYRDVCAQAKDCKEDVKVACDLNKKDACRESKSSQACQEATQKCAEKETECDRSQKGCTKLHEEEYVKYDDIKLEFLKKGKGKGKTSVVEKFDFEIVVKSKSSSD